MSASVLFAETLHRATCAEPWDACAWAGEDPDLECHDAEGRWRLTGLEDALTRAVGGAGENVITIPRPVVAHGPAGIPEAAATASYLETIATDLEEGTRRLAGSNVTAAIIKLLRDAARQTEAAVLDPQLDLDPHTPGGTR